MESLSLTLSNKALQYKQAWIKFEIELNPYSVLFGFRYFMRTYFWTVAVLTISCLTGVNSVIMMIVLFLLEMFIQNQRQKANALRNKKTTQGETLKDD